MRDIIPKIVAYQRVIILMRIMIGVINIVFAPLIFNSPKVLNSVIPIPPGTNDNAPISADEVLD